MSLESRDQDASSADLAGAQTRADSAVAPETIRQPVVGAIERIPLRRVWRWLLIIGSLYGLGWLFWSARSALTPFLIGIVLAYLLLPLVNRLERWRPRWQAIIIVYLGSLLVIIGFIAYVVPPLISQFGQLVSFIPDMHQIEDQYNLLLAQYEDTLSLLPPEVSAPIRDSVDEGLESIQSNLSSYAQNVGTFLINSIIQVLTTIVTTVTFLLGFLLIPFWLFYVLMDQRAGQAALDRLLPAAIRKDFWAVAIIIDRVLNGYVRGQLFLGFVVGCAAGFGLLVLGMFGFEIPYILLLAVFAGITELIPVIGPIIGAVPAIIIGLFDSPTTALAVTILYIAIQQLENNFLVPRIVGDSVGIHPAVLMVLLVVCSQVFGLVGAILSAPLAAVTRDVFSYIYGRLSDPPIPAGQLPQRLQKTVEPSPDLQPAAAPGDTVNTS